VIGSPRDAGREAWEGRGAVREGVEGLEGEGVKDVRRCRSTLHGRTPSRGGRGGGRSEGREEVPAHVARTGTLTSRGRIREGVGPRCTDGPSSEEEGVAGGGGQPRCTDGTLPPEGRGWGERGEEGESPGGD
jgi:hypothetical protein